MKYVKIDELATITDSYERYLDCNSLLSEELSQTIKQTVILGPTLVCVVIFALN